MSRVNPTLGEINQWLNELPTIEDLKQVPGFEIGKAYYFVRIGGKWRIGKENPYVDVKNIAGKPDNILCFADGDEINKRIAGKRDCESASLHTIRIQAVKKDANSLDRLLVGIGLRKEFLEFVWDKSPRELYEKQIADYKKSHNINNGITIIAFLIVVVIMMFPYGNKLISFDFTGNLHIANDSLIDGLSWKYQNLSPDKKILFLQKAGLDRTLSAKCTLENSDLKELISRYLDSNKDRFNDNTQRDLFLKKLSNEISHIQ